MRTRRPDPIALKQVANGYLLSLTGCQEVYTDLDGVMRRLLSYYENRSEAGKYPETYGVVIIQRDPDTLRLPESDGD